jgi:hypothetical protein
MTGHWLALVVAVALWGGFGTVCLGVKCILNEAEIRSLRRHIENLEALSKYKSKKGAAP